MTGVGAKLSAGIRVLTKRARAGDFVLPKAGLDSETSGRTRLKGQGISGALSPGDHGGAAFARITEALFVAPHVLSLIPDRHIEKRLVRHQPLAIRP